MAHEWRTYGTWVAHGSGTGDRAAGPFVKGSVTRLLANIEAPDYFNKQITPQHRAKVEDVKQLFIAAKGYTDTARYDLILGYTYLNKDAD